MRTFILGTDWGSDCDDVVAVRILARAVHAGKIRLAGVVINHGSPNGRLSWDPMLIDLAVTGDAEAAGYTTVRGTARIDADTGANHFEKTAAGLHSYVIRKYDPAYYEARLARAILSE